MKLVKVAVACVNQTPLAWDENFAHLRIAIEQARGEGVTLLCLPELAITGYGCEDTFHMDGVQDTAFLQLELLAPLTRGMVVCVGLPVYHEKALYNAAAVLVNGDIVGFAAKQFLAGDGIHYEPRWFKAWPAGEIDQLERTNADGTIRRYPIGDLVFDVGDLKLGFEICEDAWVANRPGTDLALRGVDIICNPSASHFAFGKFAVRQRFIVEGSRAYAVAYLYANLLGNEAGRVIYDGGGLIASGGELCARGRRFSFHDVELSSAVVDIDANRRDQSRRGSHRPRHDAEGMVVEHQFVWPARKPVLEDKRELTWEDRQSLREEELARAVALGLWDYLRKSRAQGYVVSLSGGADSTACAVLVALAVQLAFAELGPGGVRQHLPTCARLQKVIEQGGGAREAVGALLACAYQPTENSGAVTRHAAETIAHALGAEYHVIDVDAQYKLYIAATEQAIGRSLTWATDDITLQNIQARVRAPSIWMLANVRGAVLLTTSNRSEAAVGYATMDGDTSGGLAPIGGIDKPYLRAWLRWMETKGPIGLAPLKELAVVNAQQPTAELRPASANVGGVEQTDEADLMPYDFLESVEDSAIRDKHTPVEVLEELLPKYAQYAPMQLASWIERFFRLWCRNQWKRERLAPGFHLDDRNLDPRSWCRFPILSGGFERELAELRSYVAAGKADR
ncbi:MAG: NAD(+) synthase [Proteobacteria bacterium]|nr:NAD(+) synthase [Pseudomonadota bacterium]